MLKVRASSGNIELPRWPWFLLLTVVALEYIRPFDGFLKFLAPLHIAGLATLGMLFVFLGNRKKVLAGELLYKLVIAFWVIVSATVVFAPNNRATFDLSVALLWLYVGFTFPISAVLTNKERIYKFFFFWIVVQTILGLFVIFHGGHGPGSYLWDENDVALVMVMAIPYPVFLSRFPKLSRKVKLALYLSIAILLAGIGITASRGGVVGLAALIAVMVLVSKRPIRNGLIVATVTAVATIILLRALPAAYVEDMEDMNNPEDTTRDERLWSWSIAWVMYRENPVLGVGAGNYPWTNHLYATKSPLYTPRRKILGGRAAHSIYFTVLPELGTVGAVVFLWTIKAIYVRCATVRRYYKSQAEPSDDSIKFDLLFKAMIASCFGFLAAGAFITVIYYPPLWHLVGIIVATYRVAAEEFGFDARAPVSLPGTRLPGIKRQI